MINKTEYCIRIDEHTNALA